jgi:dinuclear metal center YbgI/SA1388 family protein
VSVSEPVDATSGDTTPGVASIRVDRICQLLAELAPLALAETWDNVGLLVGDRQQSVARVMVCLTVTPPVVQEAIDRGVDLIVTHHPLPFKPLSKITSDSTVGSLLLRLIAGKVALYSAHTAFDSASDGINQMWAAGLGLRDVKPLLPSADGAEVGGGRYGSLPEPLAIDVLARRAAAFCGATDYRTIDGGGPLGAGGLAGTAASGGSAGPIGKVAIGCGSGGGFLAAAKARGCQALITGEATFHTCLEAEACGVALVLVGHYWSERFAMERLGEWLSSRSRQAGHELEVFASHADADPLRSVARGDFES